MGITGAVTSAVHNVQGRQQGHGLAKGGAHSRGSSHVLGIYRRHQ